MSTVREVFDRPVTTGEVGIEIEVEGRSLPEPPVHWRTDHDGSLRGNAVEYVLRQPVSRDKVRDVLSLLNEAFDKEGSMIEDSGRAGIHVHINVQELTMTQAYNFIVLYLIFEDCLVRYCGEGREGNLFCLRARDAEYLIEMLTTVAQHRDWHALDTDNIRYASINCKAMATYGSLEFRGMRSTNDMQVINTWVELLLKLKDAAQKFEQPRDIIEQLSGLEPEEFHRMVFGEWSLLVTSSFDEIMEGVRRVQEIAYLPDWKAVKEEKKAVGKKRSVYLEPRDATERAAHRVYGDGALYKEFLLGYRREGRVVLVEDDVLVAPRAPDALRGMRGQVMVDDGQGVRDNDD